MAVALTALEATIQITGPGGERSAPIDSFFTLPGDTPHSENILEPGDLITHVSLPPTRSRGSQTYLKLRDRASYEFALSSAAAVLEISGERITFARLALGGIATKPWRARSAEEVLRHSAPRQEVFLKAAEAALQGAVLHSHNGFKKELAKRCIVHALTLATQNAKERTEA